jgi:hypothetical protein
MVESVIGCCDGVYLWSLQSFVTELARYWLSAC